MYTFQRILPALLFMLSALSLMLAPHLEVAHHAAAISALSAFVMLLLASIVALIFMPTELDRPTCSCWED